MTLVEGLVTAGGLCRSWPARPARWLYGEGIGVQVWDVDAPPSQQAALLLGAGGPVVLLNRVIVGTPGEGAALAWALERTAAGVPGFYVRLV